MLFNSLTNRLFRASGPKRRFARPAGYGGGTPKLFEPLEDRVLMSTYSVTNLLDHGAGSLRQAVLNANAHAGADTITFAPSAHGTITLTTGQIAVSDSVAIDGPGASALTVSGHNASRVFLITGANTSAAISGLTISNGNPGFGAGGGLFNEGKLTLTNDVVSNNVAASFEFWGFGFGGAGLQNSGTASISKCTFENNHVFTHDATLLDGGGAIYNTGKMIISQTTIDGNSAVKSPSVPIPVGPEGDTFGGNGGGIYNSGTLTALDTTIYGNSADVYAGGVFNNGPSGVSKATLINCTVAGNHGLYSGGISAHGGTVLLGNTIVAANTDVDIEFVSSVDIDIEGTGSVLTLGHNLIGFSYGPWSATDKVGTDPEFPLNPHLGPLANNGGPTKTMAINASSPAYNAGSNTLASTYGLTLDQRGKPRVDKGIVDIGAFEL